MQPLPLGAPPGAPEATVKLDLLSLLVHASGPVRLTIALLLIASTLVWVVTVLKFLQLSRIRAAERRFEEGLAALDRGRELFQLAAENRGSPGGRVVAEIAARSRGSSVERLRAVADRAIVAERQRASTLMTTLGSIASASPFIGLFGTVYGIMDAFVRIGAAKSASLPVVAPAIGEALITTAIGLAAAIPAVIFYNAIDKRIGDFVDALEASAAEWVLLVADANAQEAIPLMASSFPPPGAGQPVRQGRR